MTDQYRWAAFTNAEIRELWDGLTMDDGISYGVEEDDEPTHTLAVEMYAELKRRRIATERDEGVV